MLNSTAYIPLLESKIDTKKNVHTTITINDIVVTCTFYAIIDPNNESFITCFHTTVQESQMS